jgi:hypothetical protein
MSCPLTKAVAGLRRSRSETYYHPATGGFIPQEEEYGTREVGPSTQETVAANLMERLTRYLCHDIGCSANDLDHLDDAPCTCGLRKLYNPKGAQA